MSRSSAPSEASDGAVSSTLAGAAHAHEADPRGFSWYDQNERILRDATFAPPRREDEGEPRPKALAARTLGLLSSLALHGVLLAALLFASAKERLEAPAGGAPIEADFVVGFIDSASMQAGAQDAAHEIGAHEAPKAHETPPEETPPEETKTAEAPEEAGRPVQDPPVEEQPVEKAEAEPAPVEEAKAEAPEPQIPETPQPPAPAEVALPTAAAKPVEAVESTPPVVPKPTKPPERRKVEPKPKPEKKRVVREASKPPQRHKPASEKTKAVEAARRGTGPADSRASSRGGSGGATQFAGQASSASHRAMILAHLARYKQYPSSARAQGIHGRATVSFRVAPDGSVSGISLSRTSGASILDQATLDMVRRAAPFPAGPSAQTFNVGINYDLR